MRFYRTFVFFFYLFSNYQNDYNPLFIIIIIIIITIFDRQMDHSKLWEDTSFVVEIVKIIHSATPVSLHFGDPLDNVGLGPL